MLKSEIQPGVEYALREKRAIGAPFQRVRILEHIRKNKWKAKWIEPNPGLLDYVESGQLIVRWKEQKAFLKEEEGSERLQNHNHRLGYKEQSPVADAMYQIYESVGDEVSFYRGTLSGTAEALDRLKTRAKVTSKNNSAISYTDRQGILHLPFDEALELGRKFCAAEPATVLVGVEATERKWAQEALGRARNIWSVCLTNTVQLGLSSDSGPATTQPLLRGRSKSKGWSAWYGTLYTRCRRLAWTMKPRGFGEQSSSDTCDASCPILGPGFDPHRCLPS